MGERKEYYIEIYIPAICYNGEQDKGKFVHEGPLQTLREIDKFTSGFDSKSEIILNLINKICKDENNTFGMKINPEEVVNAYDYCELNVDSCINIVKYNKKDNTYTNINNMVLSDDIEMIETIKDNNVPISQMILSQSTNPDYVQSIVDSYNKHLLSNKQLTKQLCCLDINAEERQKLVKKIMSKVRRGNLNQKQLTSLLGVVISDPDVLSKNVDIILDKNKRMNGLRQKVEKVEKGIKKESGFILEFVEFANDMTNNFSSYSSCRKIYFFTKNYNEEKKQNIAIQK